MEQSQDIDLLGAYLIVGDDALKRDRVLVRLRKRLEALGDLTLNSDDFDGEVVDGTSLVAACNTMPFASDKRLVHVTHADKLRKADVDALVEYLASPAQSCVLALEAEKLPKSSRLYKAVSALGKSAIIDCTSPKSYEMPRQVLGMAQSHGITFTEGAARKLIELVGVDTVRLDSEIRKIALSHRGTDAVNENEVMTMVARSAEVKPWEFVDAFAARDLARCTHYLKLMPSTSPHALLAMCVARIRELMCAQSLMNRGEVAQLGATLGMPDWRVKNHATWARQYTAEELQCALSEARDAEQAMKSGGDADAVFLDWVVAVLKHV